MHARFNSRHDKSSSEFKITVVYFSNSGSPRPEQVSFESKLFPSVQGSVSPTVVASCSVPSLDEFSRCVQPPGDYLTGDQELAVQNMEWAAWCMAKAGRWASSKKMLRNQDEVWRQRLCRYLIFWESII